MEIQKLKQDAFQAAKNDDTSIVDGIRGLNVQERLFYLQMVYYYRLFDAGRLKLAEAKQIEQRIFSDYKSIDNALRLSQQDYSRMVQMSRQTDCERTVLSKQLKAGDRKFIHTLLHLLDLYTGEGIYNQMLQVMKPPLTDGELDQMIAECPDRYRQGLTAEGARSMVWRVIRQLNGDEEIA